MKRENEKITKIINEHCVEFDPTSHSYYVDGVLVPSVTQILRPITNIIYEDIDPAILTRAANLGTALHHEIELFETANIKGVSQEFHNYLKLKRQYNITPIENEVFVLIKHRDKVVCAGRLDMVVSIHGMSDLGIADVKRTSNIHLKLLTLQLNLYRIGYQQTYKKEIEFLKCIHLRNSVYSFIDVAIEEEMTYEYLDEYFGL